MHAHLDWVLNASKGKVKNTNNLIKKLNVIFRKFQNEYSFFSFCTL